MTTTSNAIISRHHGLSFWKMRKLDSFEVSIIATTTAAATTTTAITTATGPTAARENNWHVREVTATVSSVPLII